MACGPKSGSEFQERFAIPRIVEFYGATEGNVSMLNYDGTVGAVGRVPGLYRMAAAHPGGALRRRKGNAGARARTGFASNAARTKWAKRSAASPQRAGRDFEGYTNGADTREENPARCVQARAMPGFAPAT